METTRLHFLLIGKTGDGKSATGNMLLNKRQFKTSCSPTSETKLIDFYFAEFGEYVLLVVDGPGLKDTDMVEDSETAVKNMDKIKDSETAVKNMDKLKDSETASKNMDKLKDSETAAKNMDKLKDSETAVKNMDKLKDSETAVKNMGKIKEIEKAVKNMDNFLGTCFGGVDAFLLVIKFGNKFTEENKEILEALSQIYGVGFMKHVVVVVTGGDQFQTAVDDEEILNQGFHEWCSLQKGPFKELYEECDERFVLFNNKEKDEEKKRAQVQEVVQLAHGLQKRSGRYTSDSFKKADCEREKIIRQLKASQLRETFQEKICLLSRTIQDLSAQPSDDGAKIRVLARIHDIRKEIELNDKGYGILGEFQEMMTDIEEHLDDTETLKAIDKELEEIRGSKIITGGIAAVFTGAGLAARAGATAVTASVAGSFAAGSLITGTTVVAAVAAPVAASVAGATALGGAAYFGYRYYKKKISGKKKDAGTGKTNQQNKAPSNWTTNTNHKQTRKRRE